MESNEFLAFWGWRHLPWSQPPNVDQLFWQRSTLTLAQKLQAHLQRSYGLCVIEGPIGHGKSTFARWLYQQYLPAHDDVAFFALGQSQAEPGWLVPLLARYLGLPAGACSSSEVFAKLHESRLRKRPLTLIFDQAERLQRQEAYDDILSLIQAKQHGMMPVNIVLLSSSKLGKMPSLFERLAPKLWFHGDIVPFDTQEIGQFLIYYLKSLGLSLQALSPEAYSLITEAAPPTFSGIESVLESCLVEAYFKQQRIIQADVVQDVLQKRAPLLETEDSENLHKTAKQAFRKRPLAKNMAGTTAALDLNSLYYKSDGSQDPEDS